MSSLTSPHLDPATTMLATLSVLMDCSPEAVVRALRNIVAPYALEDGISDQSPFALSDVSGGLSGVGNTFAVVGGTPKVLYFPAAFFGYSPVPFKLTVTGAIAGQQLPALVPFDVRIDGAASTYVLRTGKLEHEIDLSAQPFTCPSMNSSVTITVLVNDGGVAADYELEVSSEVFVNTGNVGFGETVQDDLAELASSPAASGLLAQTFGMRRLSELRVRNGGSRFPTPRRVASLRSMHSSRLIGPAALSVVGG